MDCASAAVSQSLFPLLLLLSQSIVNSLCPYLKVSSRCCCCCSQNIVNSLCPSIYGHELVKAGLCLALFGGTQQKVSEGGVRVRGDPHVLIVGDPGEVLVLEPGGERGADR